MRILDAVGQVFDCTDHNPYRPLKIVEKKIVEVKELSWGIGVKFEYRSEGDTWKSADWEDLWDADIVPISHGESVYF